MFGTGDIGVIVGIMIEGLIANLAAIMEKFEHLRPIDDVVFNEFGGNIFTVKRIF